MKRLEEKNMLSAWHRRTNLRRWFLEGDALPQGHDLLGNSLILVPEGSRSFREAFSFLEMR